VRLGSETHQILSSEPMHTIRANLYWEFQFVLGYIAVPRSRILSGTLLRIFRGSVVNKNVAVHSPAF